MIKLTKEQESNIIESYRAIKNVWKVGELHGINGQRVHAIVKKSGDLIKMKCFSEDEEKKLIENYHKYATQFRLADLANEMGRTVNSISKKAKDLGLRDSKREFIWPDDKRKVLSQSAKDRILRDGHPKHMKGKKQSEEFKQQASDRVKRMWADPNHAVNSEEFRQMRSDSMSKWQSDRLDKSNNYSRTKFGWFEKGGKFLFMRSSWELNYAHYLNFLIKNNQIKDWEYEADTFWFEKIKRGVRSYKPDFKVRNIDESIEYHEVKGWMDDKSKTKLSRMKLYHPNIKIKVVAEKEYKAIKKISGLIKSWGNWITVNPNKK